MAGWHPRAEAKRETEAERAECERPKKKRKLKCKVDWEEVKKWQRKSSARKEKGFESVLCSVAPVDSLSVVYFYLQ